MEEKNIPVDEDAYYPGQRQAWTEEGTWERAEEDMDVYHYSDFPIEAFLPEITCFYDERVNDDHTNIYGHPVKCYCTRIEKGTQIWVSGNEIRIEIDFGTKIFEVQ